MKRQCWMALAAGLAATPSAAGAETLLTEQTLSQDAALEAATAALKTCRADGSRTTVTVLDGASRVKVVLSDDGAAPHTIEHSMRKAYTAFTYDRPSSEFGQRVASNPTAIGSLQLDKWRLRPEDFQFMPARSWSARLRCPARRAARRMRPVQKAVSTGSPADCAAD
jgi:uncharacterized protein GlcG (DUF336 family)